MGAGSKIGDNCSISAGVHIYSHDSVDHAVSGKKKPVLESRPLAIIVIGPCRDRSRR